MRGRAAARPARQNHLSAPAPAGLLGRCPLEVRAAGTSARRRRVTRPGRSLVVMTKVVRLRFEHGHRARSLVWSGDRLLDIVGGGASVALDGTSTSSAVNWAYLFDRALSSPSGEFNVLFTATATKAIIVKAEGGGLREVDRSFYHAHVYEYPLAIGQLEDGTELLIHCPDGYNRLAIDRLDDGTRLASATDKASDVFHSRLSVSPGGGYLLSAGWVWHPLGVLAVYEVAEALRDGRHLDGKGLLPWEALDAEVEAACWLDADTIVVSTNPEEEALDGESGGLSPGELGVWSVTSARWVARSRVDGHTGTLHRLGGSVLTLYGHPRLIDPFTGSILDDWPDIATGSQDSSITWHKTDPIPAIAVDDAGGRFAVADGEEVVVVEVGQ